MPDEVQETALQAADPGLFLGALQWLSRLEQMTMNVARGKYGSATRHLADFVAGPARTVAPIPYATRPKDWTEFSEVIGAPKEYWGRPVVNIVGETLMNPATYVSMPAGQGLKLFGKTVGFAGKSVDPLSLAKAGLLKGASKLPAKQAEKVLGTFGKLGKGWRRISGRQRIPKKWEAAMSRARAMGDRAADVGVKEAQAILGDVAQDEARVLYDAVTNMQFDDAGKLIGRIDPTPTFKGEPVKFMHIDEQVRLVRSRAMRLAREGMDPQRLADKAEAITRLQHTQFTEEALQGTYDAMAADLASQGQSPQDYLLRTYLDPQSENVKTFMERMGDEDLFKYAGQEGDKFVNRDLFRAIFQRTDIHGRNMMRGKLSAEILGKNEVFKWARGEGREKVLGRISELASDPQTVEAAEIMKIMMTGMPQRGKVAQVLAGANKWFKPYAVYGLLVPKFGSTFRNLVSGYFQTAAQFGPLSKEALRMGGRVPQYMWGSVNDSIRKMLGLSLSADQWARQLDLIEEASKASKGSVTKFQKILGEQDEILGLAAKYGVIDNNFIRTEELISRLTKPSIIKKLWGKMTEIPAASFQGAEQRMRVGLFTDLVLEGMDPAEAASNVLEAFYDYSVKTPSNRLLRDIIPFAQFSVNAIPQSASLLSRYPGVGVGLSQVYGQPPSEVVYPWLAERGFVELGQSKEGKPLAATGFGFPAEALGVLPRIPTPWNYQQAAQDIRRGLVSSTHPLLKTASAWIWNKEPYFDSPFGQYDKIPGIGRVGSAGRAYNIATGAGANPFHPLISMVGKATEVKSRGVIPTAVDLATGATVVEVDRHRAARQILERHLETSPTARKYTVFYKPKGEQDPFYDTVKKALATIKKADRQAAE